MLYIGIDLGTSAVKLLLMDGKGEMRDYKRWAKQWTRYCSVMRGLA